MSEQLQTTETEKEIREDEYKKSKDFEEKQGRMYPWQFAAWLSELAAATVRNALKANGAPPEVIELIDMAIIFERYANEIRYKDLNAWDAQGISQLVPETVKLLGAAGASFGEFPIEASPQFKQWLVNKPEAANGQKE